MSLDTTEEIQVPPELLQALSADKKPCYVCGYKRQVRGTPALCTPCKEHVGRMTKIGSEDRRSIRALKPIDADWSLTPEEAVQW